MAVKVVGFTSACGAMPIEGAPFGDPLGGAPLGATVVVTVATLVVVCVSAAKVGSIAKVERAAPNIAGSTQRRNFLYFIVFLCFFCFLLISVFVIIRLSQIIYI